MNDSKYLLLLYKLKLLWLTNYLTMKENDTKKLKYVPNLLKQVRNEILKAQRKF